MVALRRHRRLLLALLGGCIFALSSPPTDLYPAVLVGLALLAAAIRDAPTTVRALGLGVAWGTAAGMVGLRFVPEVIQRFTSLGAPAAYLAHALLAAAQSLVWGAGAAVAHVLARRARAPLELAFPAGVFAAVAIPTVFVWTPAGLISPWPVFLQLADVIGERGVSALLALAAALLAQVPPFAWGARPDIHAQAQAQARAPRRALVARALGAAALLGALAAHGAVRMASVAREGEGLPTARIALVNHAIGPHERWDAKNHPRILGRLRELTREAEAAGAALTVWPEAAYPYPVGREAWSLSAGEPAATAARAPRGRQAIVGGGVRGPVLAGLITRDRPQAVAPGVVETSSYNSATLVLPDGTMQPPQDKLHLLWFGETVPGGNHLPWLRRMFQKSGGLMPGEAPRALTLAAQPDGAPALRMGVLNCYEDTLPGVGRRIATALEPNLLVNVTNDAWFTGSAEPELHARLAVLRAIELRRDLVRAVNLGVASWVDAGGVVRARDERAAHDGAGVLHVSPAIREAPPTVYARFGDAPLAVTLLLACAGCAVAGRRRATPSGPSPA